VILVLKPGKDASRLASYRPISLTSCVCKLFEKMVNNRLVHTLENKGVIPEQQYGFRRNRSIIESSIQEAFRKKLVLVSVDLAKAYATCWHRYIVITLTENRIRGNMLRFVHS
jgi:hypothetical protein